MDAFQSAAKAIDDRFKAMEEKHSNDNANFRSQIACLTQKNAQLETKVKGLVEADTRKRKRVDDNKQNLQKYFEFETYNLMYYDEEHIDATRKIADYFSKLGPIQYRKCCGRDCSAKAPGPLCFDCMIKNCRISHGGTPLFHYKTFVVIRFSPNLLNFYKSQHAVFPNFGDAEISPFYYITKVLNRTNDLVALLSNYQRQEYRRTSEFIKKEMFNQTHPSKS